MGKRSLVARRRRRRFKRCQARKKKKEAQALATVCLLNVEKTAGIFESHSLTHNHPTVTRSPVTDISSWEAASPYQTVATDDYPERPPSPKQFTSDSTDISSWEADSPSNVEDVDELNIDHVDKALKGELPMVVVDEQCAIEVHLLSDLPSGSEVLKLSTEDYFRRVLDKEKQGKLAIKCLRNEVESLKTQLVTQKQLLYKEKEEAVSTVRKFWRDTLLECGSRGGKMVNAALQNSVPQVSQT